MNRELYHLSWQDVEQGAKNILTQIQERKIQVDTIVPILRGGAALRESTEQ